MPRLTNNNFWFSVRRSARKAPRRLIAVKDYTGKWRVNGDTMCFQYGQDPEACWQVKLECNQVTWVKDGKGDGTGTIV